MQDLAICGCNRLTNQMARHLQCLRRASSSYLLSLFWEQRLLPYNRVILAQPEHSDHDVQVVLADVALGKVWAGAVREAPNFDLVHCTYHTVSEVAVFHPVNKGLRPFGQ